MIVVAKVTLIVLVFKSRPTAVNIIRLDVFQRLYSTTALQHQMKRLLKVFHSNPVGEQLWKECSVLTCRQAMWPHQAFCLRIDQRKQIWSGQRCV